MVDPGFLSLVFSSQKGKYSIQIYEKFTVTCLLCCFSVTGLPSAQLLLPAAHLPCALAGLLCAQSASRDGAAACQRLVVTTTVLCGVV